MVLSIAEINTVENYKGIKDIFDTYIVKPLNSFGLSGFAFDIEDSTDVSLQADITDHYIEDNSVIQDHIAVKPDRITLTGFVGEVVYRDNSVLPSEVQDLQRKLQIANSYAVTLTQGAEQLKQATTETFQSVYEKASSDPLSVVSGATNLWGLAQSIAPPTTLQAKAFLFFESLFKKRILVSVQTPYKFYSNMAIESITASQSGSSRFITDFTITLKEIKVASTQFSEYDASNYQGYNGSQSQPVEQIADTEGKNENVSLLYKGADRLIEGLFF